jgi:hypothetical protein
LAKEDAQANQKQQQTPPSTVSAIFHTHFSMLFIFVLNSPNIISSESKKRDRDTAPSESTEPGDFSNYPDIDPKTVTALKAKGICSLFAIQ